MKLFSLILMLNIHQTNAAECVCPYAEALLDNDISDLIGHSRGHEPAPPHYKAVVASSSPPTSPRQKVFHPAAKEELDSHISTETENHFTEISTDEFEKLPKLGTAYLGFYHLDISTSFPFNAKFNSLQFDNFNARASTGIGLCDHANGMIRLLTTDNNFIYFKFGSSPITDTDIFSFSQKVEVDICEITLPHFLIHETKEFQAPQKECILTKTPFGIVRQKYAIEFDPTCGEKRDRGKYTTPSLKYTFNSPFSFCLTDILHTKTFALGSIQNSEQLVQFTQSRFNLGCIPHKYGEYDE
jgi:hypothetical protein